MRRSRRRTHSRRLRPAIRTSRWDHEDRDVLPGQCQLVPGPYTNPNGTTGWRAGTTVTVSEGVVPGTAVTAITVSPASREVPGAKKLSPLPNPTTPGPAGQDAAVLGSGETQLSFTNDSEPGGTLKVCENADPKAPATAVETFTVSSPTPAGSSTTAGVPLDRARSSRTRSRQTACGCTTRP